MSAGAPDLRAFEAGPLPPRVVLRNKIGSAFRWVCLASTWFGRVVLLVLIGGIVWKAWGWLDWQFLTSYDSYRPVRAGILAGIWGSLWLMLLTAIFAIPIGVGAAVYLEEYEKGTRLTRFIQLNLANLAGVPSIVYGILGLTVFNRMFGIFESGELGVLERAAASVIGPVARVLHIPVPFGASVLSGALTLSLLVLPIVIIATQESLRSVPASLRHASYALGATRWQTIRHQVLPAALPGILTGVILALSRAVGETAPLVMIGIPTYLRSTPGDIASVNDLIHKPEGLLAAPFSTFTALPMVIFNWVQMSKAEYQNLAAAGIVVLLGLLVGMNSFAVFIRHRFQKRIRW
jgi:phosphate transport system permease protein